MDAERERVDWDGEDGRTLALLRDLFLAGRPGPDYWSDRDLVALYERTFGARVRWKWEWVLGEAARLGLWEALGSPGPVLDLGCGSGVAGRAFFAARDGWERPLAPGGRPDALWLWDRSRLAASEAERLTRAEWQARGAPERAVEVLRQVPSGAEPAPRVVLVSHVLGELSDEDALGWLDLIARADALLWIEPGTREVSRRLGELRERLLADFAPIAPCPHAQTCPLLAAGRERDWCHLFATPAAEAFTTDHWRRFGLELGIDLRSLPLSYLVMLRRDLAPRRPEVPADRLLARPLGRPKVEKGRALLDLCSTAGTDRLRLLERLDRPFFKRLKAGPYHGLVAAKVDGERLEAIEPLDG